VVLIVAVIVLSMRDNILIMICTTGLTIALTLTAFHLVGSRTRFPSHKPIRPSRAVTEIIAASAMTLVFAVTIWYVAHTISVEAGFPLDLGDVFLAILAGFYAGTALWLPNDAQVSNKRYS
jgi:small-conductance mechanosensitive channel